MELVLFRLRGERENHENTQDICKNQFFFSSPEEKVDHRNAALQTQRPTFTHNTHTVLSIAMFVKTEAKGHNTCWMMISHEQTLWRFSQRIISTLHTFEVHFCVYHNFLADVIGHARYYMIKVCILQKYFGVLFLTNPVCLTCAS